MGGGGYSGKDPNFAMIHFAFYEKNDYLGCVNFAEGLTPIKMLVFLY